MWKEKISNEKIPEPTEPQKLQHVNYNCVGVSMSGGCQLQWLLGQRSVGLLLVAQLTEDNGKDYMNRIKSKSLGKKILETKQSMP